MRWWIFTFLLFFYCSCANNEKKIEERASVLYKHELSVIDWNDVDAYPLFDGCDESQDKIDQRLCFGKTFTDHLANLLNQFEYVLPYGISTTVEVEFFVTHKGSMHIASIAKNAIVDKYIPEFEGIVARCLRSLPKVRPALKRGIPVTTRCKVPLVLKGDEN